MMKSKELKTKIYSHAHSLILSLLSYLPLHSFICPMPPDQTQLQQTQQTSKIYKTVVILAILK